MIKSFGLEPGERISEKYKILGFLGGGWEGEVYKIREIATNIDRAAKLFFPHRNRYARTANNYAKKLHKLRTCPVLIQYHTMDNIIYRDEKITMFISEYVEGQLLTEYLKRFRGKILPYYQGLHLLHALTLGIESIHHLGEYHGDLHSQNVIVQRLGVQMDLKLLDLYNHGRPTLSNLQNDILGIIRIYYDAVGGAKKYSTQPDFVKSICCGLKHSLILKKFKTASRLRLFLEANDWS